MKRLLPLLLFVSCAFGGETWDGYKSKWHDGFDRYDFVMDDDTVELKPFERPAAEGLAVEGTPKGKHRCVVVVPKNAAEGNPWSWQGFFWNAGPAVEIELLQRGFHIAYVSGDPSKYWDAWYKFLVEKHGLAKRPSFFGMSHGAGTAMDWAVNHPDKTSCLYIANPAITPEAFNKMSSFVQNEIAILDISGSQDSLLQKYAIPFEERFRRMGGSFSMIIKDGPSHMDAGLRNSKPAADWIIEHQLPGPHSARPDWATDAFFKTYFYSDETVDISIAGENSFAAARGPGIVPAYDRFDAKSIKTNAFAGLTVIAPKTPAAGKPWVFRASAISAADRIDLALLARGFHIAVAPLTELSGPSLKQWNAAYDFMTNHGFATKPVLEGSRAAAGEAYAWSIENPDKVSGIIAENPIFHSLLIKKPLLENLSVLKKANLPILHICDKVNPWFDANTGVARGKYKAIKLLVKDNDIPLSKSQLAEIADFAENKK